MSRSSLTFSIPLSDSRIQARFNLKIWAFMVREIKHNRSIPLHHNRDSDKVKILCEICSLDLDIYVRYFLTARRKYGELILSRTLRVARVSTYVSRSL